MKKKRLLDLELLNTKEAAARLKKHPNTLAVWRRRKRGPKYVRLGGQCFYTEQWLESYVRGRVVDPWK